MEGLLMRKPSQPNWQKGLEWLCPVRSALKKPFFVSTWLCSTIIVAHLHTGGPPVKENSLMWSPVMHSWVSNVSFQNPLNAGTLWRYRGFSPYANFISANFISVNFIGANFISANFISANFISAIFQNFLKIFGLCVFRAIYFITAILYVLG